MTDEEKAEEYASEDNIYVCGEDYWSHNDIKQAYLAGLHEGQPKWHDLRKDPNDLPKEDVVLVQTKSNCHFIALYYPAEKWWGTYELLSQRIRGEIIAWCEIPQFNSEE